MQKSPPYPSYEETLAWFTAHGGITMSKTPIRQGLIYPLLAEAERDFAGCKVIDVGCGNGALNYYFRDAAYHHWSNLDFNPHALALAQAHLDDPRIHFIQHDVRYPFPIAAAAHDVAISIFVIEEIPPEHITRYLADIRRILRPGGRFYLFSNNPLYLLVHDLQASETEIKEPKFAGHQGYFAEIMSKQKITCLPNQRRTYYHKTLSTLLNAAFAEGLQLTRYQEIPKLPDQQKTLTALRNFQPQSGDVLKYLFLKFVAN